ncbi:unnamed protein product [Boreogadus saida]
MTNRLEEERLLVHKEKENYIKNKLQSNMAQSGPVATPPAYGHAPCLPLPAAPGRSACTSIHPANKSCECACGGRVCVCLYVCVFVCISMFERERRERDCGWGSVRGLGGYAGVCV